MKKIILSTILMCILCRSYAQLNIGAGAQWKTTGNASVVLQDIALVNNGTMGNSAGVFKFAGTQNTSISGNGTNSFDVLEIAKSNGAKILLGSNISVNSSIKFTAGFIDLNQKTISLAANAILNNENENSRITGSGGGEVRITTTLNKPGAVNPGNLGAVFTSGGNLGTVTIKRGHKALAGTGLNGSIHRYFDIEASSKNVKATVRLKYFDAELNNQLENSMAVYQSMNSGATWTNISFNSRDLVQNWVEKTNLSSFGRLTLSSNAGVSPSAVNKSNELTTENKSISKNITVGPNPNNGNFWFIISGIDKETAASIYTVDGKLIKQFKAVDLQRQQVNGLPAGMYVLQAEGYPSTKILVR